MGAPGGVVWLAGGLFSNDGLFGFLFSLWWDLIAVVDCGFAPELFKLYSVGIALVAVRLMVSWWKWLLVWFKVV